MLSCNRNAKGYSGLTIQQERAQSPTVESGDRESCGVVSSQQLRPVKARRSQELLEHDGVGGCMAVGVLLGTKGGNFQCFLVHISDRITTVFFSVNNSPTSGLFSYWKEVLLLLPATF